MAGTSKGVMADELDDKDLVRLCRQGQTRAFEVLVRRYQERLYPTVLRLAGCAEDAQDILQDAFVRAYEKIDQFQGGSSFYTWVYRIAVNLALSLHRKRTGRVRLERSPEPADPSPEIDPSMPLERAELEAQVEAALAALAPEYRAVVVLKDFDDRRYEEISAILGIPIGTVRSRLHRARCELRERLRGLVDDAISVRNGLSDEV